MTCWGRKAPCEWTGSGYTVVSNNGYKNNFQQEMSTMAKKKAAKVATKKVAKKKAAKKKAATKKAAKLY